MSRPFVTSTDLKRLGDNSRSRCRESHATREATARILSETEARATGLVGITTGERHPMLAPVPPERFRTDAR